MLEHFESIVSTDVMTFTEKIENMHNAKEVQKVVEKNTLTLLQWRLKNLIEKHTENNPSLSDSATIRWILSDVDMLELLLNSGYVSDHRCSIFLLFLYIYVYRVHRKQQKLKTCKGSFFNKNFRQIACMQKHDFIATYCSYT